MRSYHCLLQNILDYGEDHSDRTGVGTLSVFGEQWRHYMALGFPLLTTKRVPLRWVAEELFWFLSGSTNEKDLQARGVDIWAEWRRPYDSPRNLVLVDRRNATMSASYHGDYRFPGTYDGSEETKKLANAWRKMMIRCYDKSSHNYHLYGGAGKTVHPAWHDPTKFIHDVKLLPHWWYKKNDWNRFQLDSDYYGAGQYGPETSVWLSTEENNKYTKSAKSIKAIDSEGREYLFPSANEASLATGISSSSLSRRLKFGPPKIAKQGNKAFVGWEFEVVDESERLVRLELIPDGDLGPVYGQLWRSFPVGTSSVDQIAKILDQIMETPNSRRIIVSGWHPQCCDEVALPPCHTLWQIKVHQNGELSLHLYQRSCDAFLGLPFNIASYALLLKMIAHVTGKGVRDLVISFGDLHLYRNHIEQAKLQLSRKPFRLPQVHINSQLTGDPLVDLLTIGWDDIELVDYQHHSAIKADVAV